MHVIVKLVVYTAVIAGSSEQFVFPDRVLQALSERIVVTSGFNMTEQEQLSPQDENPVIDTDNFYNEISLRYLIEGDTVCQDGDGTDFCTEPSNYPTEVIAKAVHNQKQIIQSMFDTANSTLQLRSGLGSFFGSENVCGMSTTHIMPKAARNKRGQFKFLVNGREGVEEYVQLVRISQCLGVGESCGNGKIFTRQVTECKQEFTDHKLVALDEEGKELVIDTFSFPSCCSCYVQTGLEL